VPGSRCAAPPPLDEQDVLAQIDSQTTETEKQERLFIHLTRLSAPAQPALAVTLHSYQIGRVLVMLAIADTAGAVRIDEAWIKLARG
jgi:hypothetical protein